MPHLSFHFAISKAGANAGTSARSNVVGGPGSHLHRIAHRSARWFFACDLWVGSV